MSEALDAIILGGGIAAYASALKLSVAGARVLIADDLRSPPDRVETLSPQAANWLNLHGIEAGVPLEHLAAWWGSEESRDQRYAGARVVQHHELLSLVRNSVLAREVSIRDARSCGFPTRRSASWHLDSGDGGVTAPYLIDATGRSAVVGRRMGARRLAGHELFCASLALATDGRIGTWTEAVPDGWWNLTSVRERESLCFYSDGAGMRKARTVLPVLLSQAQHIRALVPDAHGKPNIHACGSSLLRPAAGPGWVAVGDAAATVQPLASSGLARAFRDADSILTALSNPKRYDERHQSEYSAYTRALSRQYSLETRWMDGTFWTLRSSSPVMARP